MWHSCVRMTVRDHVRGRPKEVVDLYRRFARMVQELGPGVKAVPVKDRDRVHGPGPVHRGRAPEGRPAGEFVKRRIDNPRFEKVELMPPRNFVYSFHVRSPEDLDDELRACLAEAYRVGIQEHPAAPAKGEGVTAARVRPAHLAGGGSKHRLGWAGPGPVGSSHRLG
jgi:hypothetical protein